MDNIYVSIIVPVYNVEDYIEECIESLINQTLKNIEIILINDGSTDKSLEILKKYSDIDNRIKVIEQENSGLAMTRNRGVEESTGKYLMFIDSDDYIEKDMVYRMYMKAEKNDCPLIISDLELVWDDGKKNKLNGFKHDETKKYKSEELTDFLLNSEMYCQVVNKIYRRDLWSENNICFESGRYYEDIVPSFKIVDIYKEAMYINDAMYKYRMRSGSIVSNPSKKKVCDYLMAIDEVVRFVEERYGNKFITSIKAFRVAYGIEALNLASRLENNEEKTVDYEKNLDYTFKEVLFNKRISKNNKNKFVLYKLKLYWGVKKIFRHLKRKAGS
ncbi:MAG: glycosyltransferase [Clostridium sp.]|uniref:glycosyltransferase n=1 Tax=Clostridium sp. TaxID=1506 RepID=UPI003F2DBD5E